MSRSVAVPDVHVGSDEAGKGPVLGSMFAAAVRADPDELPAAVADSKRLSPERREQLDGEIRRCGTVAVVEVPVGRIDDPETDMNGLTVDAHAEAIGSLTTGGEEGYLDAADTNAVRFERRVADRLETDLELRAQHQADEEYAAVSAASIVAKVARDAHVEELAERYGDLGSGYPGDETTRTFLRTFVEEHGHLPDCARASWQTAQDVLARCDQASLAEFESDRDGQSSLSEF
jgi:ribonuclease HII